MSNLYCKEVQTFLKWHKMLYHTVAKVGVSFSDEIPEWYCKQHNLNFTKLGELGIFESITVHQDHPNETLVKGIIHSLPVATIAVEYVISEDMRDIIDYYEL